MKDAVATYRSSSVYQHLKPERDRIAAIEEKMKLGEALTSSESETIRRFTELRS